MRLFDILKRISLMGLVLLLIISLFGCNTKEDIVPISVTYVYIGAEPYSYDAYIFTPDEFTHYDFTDYSMNQDFDYFTDDLTSGEYNSEKYALDESEWDKIVKSINDNHFSKLPEEISDIGIADVGTSYIQVETEEMNYLSGGGGSGFGVTKADKTYSKIKTTLLEIIKNEE